MNKSILLSLISIFAVVGLTVGLAVAYFSNQGTSSANVFNSGTLDMKLSNTNDSGSDGVSGTWGLNSAPGDTFSGDLYIRNSGSVDANHIELSFSNTVTNAADPPGNVSTTPMDRVIEITALAWDTDGNGSVDQNILPTVGDSGDKNGNGIIDLDDLENLNVSGITDFDDLNFGGIDGNNHKLHMEGRLHPDMTVNQHQGDSVTMELTVDMNQNSSQ